MKRETVVSNKQKVFRFRVSDENLRRFNEMAGREKVTLSELTRRLLEERASQIQA
ncbi:hypothetical protein I5U08_02505 [Stenotrophomonas maltophilia]|nr:hypothetical protein [Stenotrophomonas maltophilia]